MNQRLHRLVYHLRMFSWLGDLYRLRKVPAYPIDRPIFLLGTQGGGLTLLSRMLRRHPDVVSAAGNSRYWTAADEMQNVFGMLLPPELTGLRYKAPPHPLFAPPRSWTYAARDLFPIYRKTAADGTNELREALERFIRFAAMRHADNPHRFRFVDKSQSYTVRVGLLYELLKDSRPRFVLVSRDPYVAVSRAASGGIREMAKLRRRISYAECVDVCSEHYANSMRAALDDAATHGLEMVKVRFERLLEQPRDEIQRVCRSVELDFVERMLPNEHDVFPIGTRNLDRWYPLRRNVNERYEGNIDQTVIKIVNKRVGKLVDELGYERRR